ncbi:MAG: PorV/PorQ family protein [Elusimicrobia bacterium]|nr:PorV/PorQ family protein [Elusimicrobiota bacterium]
MSPITKVKNLVISFFFAVVIAISAQAKGGGSNSGDFLKIPVGGRGVAMGGALTAAVSDVTALYWNPSLLSGLNRKEILLSHNQLFLGSNHDVFYYAHPTAKVGTFGMGFSMFRVDDIAGYDANNVPTKKLTSMDSVSTLGWGKTWSSSPLIRNLNLGINVKYLREDLGGDSASAFLYDIGLSHQRETRWKKGLKVALVLQNLGKGIRFEKESSPLPTATKVGFYYPMLGESLGVSGDLVLPKNGSLSTHFGFEYKVMNAYSLRLGYRGRDLLSNGLTYGIGFGGSRYRLDYAFVPYGALGESHRFSFGVRFGRTSREITLQNLVNGYYERSAASLAQGRLVESYREAKEILNVAPWHEPTRALVNEIETDITALSDRTHMEEVQARIDGHFSQGMRYFQKDELVAAKKEFLSILALKPEHPEANTYLQRINSRFSSFVQGLYENGMRSFASGDYKNAKEQFEKALAVNPEYVEARAQLKKTNEVLLKQNQDAAARTQKQWMEKRFRVARDLSSKGDCEEAIAVFNEILRADPQNKEAKDGVARCRETFSKTHLAKAEQALAEGRLESAKEEYQNVLRISPSDAAAKEKIQKITNQVQSKQKEESVQLYKEGLDFFLADDYAKASELWKKAIALDPSNVRARRSLERITQKTNMTGDTSAPASAEPAKIR